jgi:hypothetical protein
LISRRIEKKGERDRTAIDEILSELVFDENHNKYRQINYKANDITQ